MADDSGEFAIHAAAREGRAGAVESYLNAQPRLISKKDLDGRVPLHWAVANNHLDIVNMLLDSKSFDPDVEDDLAWTPLMMASNLIDGDQIVALLLQKGADATLKNTAGQTALHFAASKGNLDTARNLIAHKASTRIRDRRSQLPLHRAAAAGWSPMCTLLLEHNSPINTSDDSGLTPLHHAIAEGRGDTAFLLLKGGADSSKRDKDEQLAISLAPDAKVRNFVLSRAEQDGIEVTIS